jgi:2-oxo-4-hydroxy-4-carboxy-5-ureidoimidazoline decarboxylase
MTPEPERHSIQKLNDAGADQFVHLVGPVFEHSPWVAEGALAKRPFATLAELHRGLCDVVREAGEEQQLALIRAHPDLVGRAALAGTLTSASSAEQADAGLNHLSAEEIAWFQEWNAAYRARFGFPFVICARLNKKDAIRAGLRTRLEHSQADEIQAALEEIFKIAWLRLQDIVEP